MKKIKEILNLVLVMVVGVLMVGCASSPKSSAGASAGPIKVEFESGVVEGNIVMNAGPDKAADGELQPASGDMFYMKDSGSLTVEFDLPSAGDYIVKIYFAIPDSYAGKENNVIINGEDLGPLGFPITQGKWAAKWIQASLKEGKNTLTVAHNWGYTWYDYVSVEPIN